jgi:N-acetylglucosamine kinase-like BadF-type ATPase
VTTGWFAVDAGGSRTRLRVEAPGRPAEVSEYPSVNPATAGERRAGEVLRAVFEAVRRQLGHRPGVGWFASATVDERTGPAESERLVPAVPDGTSLVLSNDIVPMLWGPPALAGTGVAVVCGTGAGFLARRGDGRTAQAGGCEYLGSDEGSAFDLGLRGLRAAIRAGDGRGPATAVTERIREQAGAAPAELARALAGEPFPKARVAALAPAVGAAWRAGDPVAARLGAEVVDELVLGVRTVAARLELGSGWAVAAAGGLVTGCPELFALLRARLLAGGAGSVELIRDPVAVVAGALRRVVGAGDRPELPVSLRRHAWVVRS